AILQDRKNLEALQARIDELKKLQDAANQLAERESHLRTETGDLQTASKSPEQKAFEAALAELARAETDLLTKNESFGRESGAIGLEQLEHELERLLADQRVDRAVLESWDPGEREALAAANAALSDAVRQDGRAARLSEARDEIGAAARAL